MKKVRIVSLVVIFVAALFLNIAYSADKFAYVDLSRIFSEYKKTQDYEKTLGDKESVYSKERDKKIDELKKLQDKLNLLSDKDKETKQKDLEIKVKDLQGFDRQNQTDLRKEQDEKMKEILKDIEETVKSYSEKEGYTMVFNDRVLVYQVKNMDITDKIVSILNKNYKK